MAAAYANELRRRAFAQRTEIVARPKSRSAADIAAIAEREVVQSDVDSLARFRVNYPRQGRACADGLGGDSARDESVEPSQIQLVGGKTLIYGQGGNWNESVTWMEDVSNSLANIMFYNIVSFK